MVQLPVFPVARESLAREETMLLAAERRRWRHGLVVVSFLLLAMGMARGQEVSTREALQAALTMQQASRPADAAPDPLFDFYAARNFAPAWTSNAGEGAGEAVLFALAHADAQGLHNEDYASAAARWPDAPLPGVEAAAFELSLTADLMRYVADVRLGRVNPTQVYQDVALPSRTFDFGVSLNRALKSYALDAFLAELPPPQSGYRALVRALANYRQLAAAGGWPMVPGKGEVVLDTPSPRLSILTTRLSLEDAGLAGMIAPTGEDLRGAVKRFQARNGIVSDGRAGGATLAALNTPVGARITQIIANMERWRWLPREFEDRYILVNVPDQSTQFFAHGEMLLESRAVVGRLSSKTPIARMVASSLVVNPPWHVPDDIAADQILPKLRREPNYLAVRNMVLVNGPAGDPQGKTIDWRKVKTMPYYIDQSPGPDSAMGVLMLDSPNAFGVYLHDTPGKALFGAAMRQKSNGCIRVEQMMALSSLLLTGDAETGAEALQHIIAAGQTQRLTLGKPVPVYLIYQTAIASQEGAVGFRTDFYGRDRPLIARLGAPRKILP
jgi:murein L,D-transpeptidase YcbB/YkuD